MAASAPQTIAFAIAGPIARGDLPGLCERICALLHAHPGTDTWICDVHSVDADATTVDALARLQLGARRNATCIHLANASPQLTALIDLLGLTEVLAKPPTEAGARTAGTGAPSTGRT